VGRGYATAEIAATSQKPSEHSGVESSGSATEGQEEDLSTHEGSTKEEVM
jgi:hypothetical protein